MQQNDLKILEKTIDNFEPWDLLKNRHLMTVAPVIWPRSFKELKETCQEVLFKIDENTSVEAKCHFLDNNPNRPTLIIIHGLEGSADSRYVIGISAKAIRAQMNIVRLNLRNCGEKLNLTPTLYNAGQSSDVLKVVEILSNDYNKKNIYLVGFSLGGNIVLKAGCETENNYAEIKGIGAISPSLDLVSCIKAIGKGLNKFYEFRFLLSLKRKVLLKSKYYPKTYDIPKLIKTKSLVEFDNEFTAPDAGYKSAYDYYKGASAVNKLNKLSVPSMIITSQDDPIIPFESFENELITKNKNLKLIATQYGGHGGFIDKNNYNKNNSLSFDRFWAENQIIKFCNNLNNQPF